jgi:hypothetical protein
MKVSLGCLLWCGSLLEPRAPLPASDASVALYLQSVVNDAKSFAPVKAASAAIAFFQKEGDLRVG